MLADLQFDSVSPIRRAMQYVPTNKNDLLLPVALGAISALGGYFYSRAYLTTGAVCFALTCSLYTASPDNNDTEQAERYALGSRPNHYFKANEFDGEFPYVITVINCIVFSSLLGKCIRESWVKPTTAIKSGKLAYLRGKLAYLLKVPFHLISLGQSLNFITEVSVLSSKNLYLFSKENSDEKIRKAMKVATFAIFTFVSFLTPTLGTILPLIAINWAYKVGLRKGVISTNYTPQEQKRIFVDLVFCAKILMLIGSASFAGKILRRLIIKENIQSSWLKSCVLKVGDFNNFIVMLISIASHALFNENNFHSDNVKEVMGRDLDIAYRIKQISPKVHALLVWNLTGTGHHSITLTEIEEKELQKAANWLGIKLDSARPNSKVLKDINKEELIKECNALLADIMNKYSCEECQIASLQNIKSGVALIEILQAVFDELQNQPGMFNAACRYFGISKDEAEDIYPHKEKILNKLKVDLLKKLKQDEQKKLDFVKKLGGNIRQETVEIFSENYIGRQESYKRAIESYHVQIKERKDLYETVFARAKQPLCEESVKRLKAEMEEAFDDLFLKYAPIFVSSADDKYPHIDNNELINLFEMKKRFFEQNKKFELESRGPILHEISTLRNKFNSTVAEAFNRIERDLNRQIQFISGLEIESVPEYQPTDFFEDSKKEADKLKERLKNCGLECYLESQNQGNISFTPGIGAYLLLAKKDHEKSIKANYKRLSLLFHPDKIEGLRAEFQVIEAAYRAAKQE